MVTQKAVRENRDYQTLASAMPEPALAELSCAEIARERVLLHLILVEPMWIANEAHRHDVVLARISSRCKEGHDVRIFA